MLIIMLTSSYRRCAGGARAFIGLRIGFSFPRRPPPSWPTLGGDGGCPQQPPPFELRGPPRPPKINTAGACGPEVPHHRGLHLRIAPAMFSPVIREVWVPVRSPWAPPQAGPGTSRMETLALFDYVKLDGEAIGSIYLRSDLDKGPLPPSPLQARSWDW